MSAHLPATRRLAIAAALLLCCVAVLWHGGVAAATAGLPTTVERPAAEAPDEAAGTRAPSNHTTRRAMRVTAPRTASAAHAGVHDTTTSGAVAADADANDPPGRAPPRG